MELASDRIVELGFVDQTDSRCYAENVCPPELKADLSGIKHQRKTKIVNNIGTFYPNYEFNPFVVLPFNHDYDSI